MKFCWLSGLGLSPNPLHPFEVGEYRGRMSFQISGCMCGLETLLSKTEALQGTLVSLTTSVLHWSTSCHG